MKRNILSIIIFLFVFVLAGCSNNGEGTGNKTSTAKESATASANETAPVTTKAPDGEGLLTSEDAIEIVKEADTGFGKIGYLYQALKVVYDVDQKYEENEEYVLVTDERFQSMQDLRDYLRTACTDNYINSTQNYMVEGIFNNKYIEKNGKLYVSNLAGGKGNGRTIVDTSITILNQNEETLEVKYDVLAWPVDALPSETETMILKKENEIWLIDSIITVDFE